MSRLRGLTSPAWRKSIIARRFAFRRRRFNFLPRLIRLLIRFMEPRASRDLEFARGFRCSGSVAKNPLCKALTDFPAGLFPERLFRYSSNRRAICLARECDLKRGPGIRLRFAE